MENIDLEIRKIEEEEKELQFISFSNDDALNIGLKLIEKARKEQKIITIDITRSGQQVFHFAFSGTSQDNDKWIIRKNNVVRHFGKSSLLVGLNLQRDGKSIEEAFYISSFEFSAHGGAFPIIIKNTGVIGSITVSGLPQKEDHSLVVSVIKEYLNLNK